MPQKQGRRCSCILPAERGGNLGKHAAKRCKLPRTGMGLAWPATTRRAQRLSCILCQQGRLMQQPAGQMLTSGSTAKPATARKIDHAADSRRCRRV